MNCFKSRDLGQLAYFLNVELEVTQGQTKVSQCKYSMDLLCRFNMLDYKPIDSPTALQKLLTLSKDNLLADLTLYHSLAGGLQYLMRTKPDLAFVVNQVCKYMQTPTDYHMTTAKRILHYVKATLSVGLTFHLSTSTSLTVMVDAD